ncbi:alpha/beta hydrolase [Salinispira pacifica]|uniref:Lysophospholipase n=1 Tax=Salinispira pacifica TaxID=1307761 RepID=V5WN07_9SPIO|nr:alpha/beta fold hydrolase [Salinispira pacifica]AHC16554.1 Lysophospholipase [Salinispira pacifica]
MVNKVPGFRAVYVLFLVAAALIFTSCASVEDVPTEIQTGLMQLEENLGVEWRTADEIPGLREYGEYFGFGPFQLEARYMYGEFGRIFLVRQRPEGVQAKGIVVLVHGYMAHAGHMADMAGLFTTDGWTVILPDLPGHGLSDGPRNDIDHFSHYGDVLNQLYSGADIPDNLPCILMGHSTGASAIIETQRILYREHRTMPDGVIFAAPLVDMKGFRFRSSASAILGGRSIEIPPFVQNPTVLPRGVSKNPEFREFSTQGDPLLSSVYAPGWLEAYSRWIESWDEIPENMYGGPLLVLQGTGDSVVDWKSGIPKLRAPYGNRQFTRPCTT